jgi:hypothetical protein
VESNDTQQHVMENSFNTRKEKFELLNCDCSGVIYPNRRWRHPLSQEKVFTVCDKNLLDTVSYTCIKINPRHEA